MNGFLFIVEDGDRASLQQAHAHLTFLTLTLNSGNDFFQTLLYWSIFYVYVLVSPWR